jgi:hypothetical protein
VSSGKPSFSVGPAKYSSFRHLSFIISIHHLNVGWRHGHNLAYKTLRGLTTLRGQTQHRRTDVFSTHISTLSSCSSPGNITQKTLSELSFKAWSPYANFYGVRYPHLWAGTDWLRAFHAPLSLPSRVALTEGRTYIVPSKRSPTSNSPAKSWITPGASLSTAQIPRPNRTQKLHRDL